MAHFTKGGGDRARFGRNQILRSTKPGSIGTKSYTVAGGPTGGVPVEVVDGFDERVLQVGEAMAKITSGPNAGKIGVRQEGVTDGREDLANLVGISLDLFATELMHRDVEASVVFRADLNQGWCTERDASGKRVVLANATADALRGKKSLQILFH